MDKYKKRLIDQAIKDAKQQGLSKAQAKQRIMAGVKDYEARFGGEDAGLLEKIFKGMTQPVVKTGKNILGLGAHLAQMAEIGLEKDPQKKAQLASNQNPFFSQREFQQLGDDPLKAVYEQGIKPAAGTLAYAVPVGKAGTVAQAAKLGAGAGSLGALGATPEQANFGETALNVGVGAGTGAVMAGVTKGVSNKVKGIIETRRQKQALLQEMQKKGWKPSDGGIGHWADENWMQKQGTKEIASQYKVPVSMARKQVNVNETARKMADYGIPNVDKYQNASNVVTGKNGVVTKITRNAVGKADDVDTTGLIEMFDDMLVNTPEIDDGSANRARAYVSKTMVDMLGGSKGSIKPKANPIDTFSTIQALEKKGWNLVKGSGTPWNVNPNAQGQGRAYLLLADELKDRLFIESGADDQIIAAITSKQAQQLNALSPKLLQDVSAAQSVGQLRSVAKPFVDAGRIANETINVQASPFYSQFGNNAGQGLQRALPSVQDPLAPLRALAGSNAGRSSIGQLMRMLGGAQQSAGQALQPVAQGVGITTGRNIPSSIPSVVGGVGANSLITPELLQRLQAMRSQQQTLP